MNRILFWSIYFVIFLRIMIYKSDLNGRRMMLLYGIIEVYSIVLRISSHLFNSDIRNDYEGSRIGHRVVSVGEHPYFDPLSKSRREALKAYYSICL